MGWLDNSTNNIILDAVLTDYGRQTLARNNGSFNITKFSLGDDEVNYGIIQKYGRTIGREKIEKNTPIFEALTNQNLSLKYKLISIPASLVYLPKLTLSSDQTVALTQGGDQKQVTVQLKNTTSDSNQELNDSLADANLDLYYPSLFLTVNDITPGYVSLDTLRTAHLVVSMSGNNVSKNSQFTVKTKSITTSTFQTYGRLTTSSNYQISTSIRVVGQSSGLSYTIPVNINSTQQ